MVFSRGLTIWHPFGDFFFFNVFFFKCIFQDFWKAVQVTERGHMKGSRHAYIQTCEHGQFPQMRLFVKPALGFLARRLNNSFSSKPFDFLLFAKGDFIFFADTPYDGLSKDHIS